MKVLQIGFWVGVFLLVLVGCQSLTESEKAEIQTLAQESRELISSYKEFVEKTSVEISELKSNVESFNTRIEELIKKQKAGELTSEEVEKLSSDLYTAIEKTTALIDTKKAEVTALYERTAEQVEKISDKINKIIEDAKERGLSTWETWGSILGAFAIGLITKSPGPTAIAKTAIGKLAGVKKEAA